MFCDLGKMGNVITQVTQTKTDRLCERQRCGLDVKPEVAFREGQQIERQIRTNMKTSMKVVVLIGLSALAVSQASANLVNNGDFSAGNSGFTSGYTYVAPGGPAPSGNPNTLWDEGTYSIGTDPNSFHASWATFAAPGGSGNMMIVNGDRTANVTIWQGTLTSGLVAGQTYELSAYVANLYPPPVASGTAPTAPAQLQFSVGGIQVGSTYTAPGVGVWYQFTTTFVAGTGPISVLDLNTLPNGNDFALANISLVAVPEPTTMVAGALLLLPFGASTLRILRRRTA
jgi:hypothetical protein